MAESKNLKTFYFVRHGRTDWNLQRKLLGRDDIPLNDLGIADALAHQRFFADIALNEIVCSPLKRACQTARVINEEKNVPIVQDHRLVEMDYGYYSGKDVATHWQQLICGRGEGVEQQEVVCQRMKSVYHDLCLQVLSGRSSCRTVLRSVFCSVRWVYLMHTNEWVIMKYLNLQSRIKRSLPTN